jgi:hypothetical protein
MYTITDLIEKLINIEQAAVRLYDTVGEIFKSSSPSISIVARSFCKVEKGHILFYEQLKSSAIIKSDTEIDFFLYDKAAKLLFEFKESMRLPEVNNVQDLLKYAVDFEKKNIGLLLDIQGRLFMKPENSISAVYGIITLILNEEQEHESTFSKFMVNNVVRKK